jgi:hypothetical protein
MTIDPENAAEALRTVEATETRARSARLYHTASAPLLIWGLVWFAANLSCQFLPTQFGAIWLVADAVGLAGSFVAVRMAAGNKSAWSRQLIALGAVIIFTVCATIVVGPISGKQITGLTSLTIALCCLLAGVYGAGTRFAVLGLALMAAIVAAYQLLPDYRYLSFGIVGGGGLCLAALWIRKV